MTDMLTAPGPRVLGEILEDRASDHPDREFLVTPNSTWTYAEFNARVTQLAVGLTALGLQKGDKLAIMMPNSADFMALWFACARLGVIEVPINTAYKGPTLRYIIEHSDATVLATDASLLERFANPHVGYGAVKHIVRWHSPDSTTPSEVQELTPPSVVVSEFGDLETASGPLPTVDVRPTDTMAILYSSGTTGRSKGIVTSHNYFWHSGARAVTNRPISTAERLYTCLPLFHANAQLVTAMPALTAGATLIVDNRFTASGFWHRLKDFQATRFAYIGGMIPILMKQPESPADRAHNVRIATGGAAPKDQHRAFEKRFGLTILEGYGQTENCVALTNPADAPRLGSLGKGICGYDVELVDDDENFLGPHQTGELVFRPQMPSIMMDGYYKNPEATLAQSKNLWFHTGDLMWKDEDGYFYFVDRKKDAIRRRGENISAFEVEMVVNSYPGVLESAAVAVPSDVGEDEVMVSVIPVPDTALDPLALIKHCEEHMPYFAVPRYIDIRSEFPKTPTHRVEKYKIRQEGVRPDTWDREAVGYSIKR